MYENSVLVFDPVNDTYHEADDGDYEYMYERPLPRHHCFFCGGIQQDDQRRAGC